EAGPFVLALGRAEPRKRHAELVAAFGRLAAEVPGIRLVVAGPDGPATAAVVAARDGLPGAARNAVHLLGHVDDVTRSALLRNAALLAYPSSYEGFGFPVLEAMQAGTPVVAASGGAVAEVAGDAAVLVDESGVAFVDALADALRRVVTDETLRHRLVESGHHRVEEFGWEKTAAGMVDLYREAADG
ncbi:MAG TPA: glycosyltransferase, partial [Acidimicrobiia bacterium]|nr:glycosyltransferase [Acidimicrobiia bacterium]